MGHEEGLSTMLVPGAGEPNFDSWVADPYQSKRARREQEVRQLLDKLKPEMIVLDPSTIGQVSFTPILNAGTVVSFLSKSLNLALHLDSL